MIDNSQFPKIKITHVPTNESVSFNPYITDFSDNFASSWEPVDVFGRMDSIKNFTRTTRTISITFNIISENIEEAKQNYEKTSRLMSFLYPVYRSTNYKQPRFSPSDIKLFSDEIGGITDKLEALQQQSGDSLTTEQQQFQDNIKDILSSKKNFEDRLSSNASFVKTRESSVMNSPPILKANFSNLIKSGDGGDLYGATEGLTYKPDTEAGYFIEGKGSSQMMYAKIVEISFSFTVLHTSPLGWKYDEKQNQYKLRDSNFPFYKKRN